MRPVPCTNGNRNEHVRYAPLEEEPINLSDLFQMFVSMTLGACRKYQLNGKQPCSTCLHFGKTRDPSQRGASPDEPPAQFLVPFQRRPDRGGLQKIFFLYHRSIRSSFHIRQRTLSAQTIPLIEQGLPVGWPLAIHIVAAQVRRCGPENNRVRMRCQGHQSRPGRTTHPGARPLLDTSQYRTAVQDSMAE